MFLLMLMFLLGVALLFFGAGWLVRGAAALAETFNVPKTVVGLTLVALGTSAPELFVNIIAAVHGNTDFALANVSGSNLANICFGFGLCGLWTPLAIRRADFASDCLLVFLLPLVVMGLIFTNEQREVPFLSFVPLTAILAYYLWSLRGRADPEEGSAADGNLWIGLLLFALGGVALYGGGELVLAAALQTAHAWGVSEDIIGLTVVAIGTSVPDITASVVATRRQEFGIAVGNILGSNISNIALVLNGTILVSGGGLATVPNIRLDYLVVCVISLFFCVLARTTQTVSQWSATAMLVVYLGYMAYRLAMLEPVEVTPAAM